MSTTGEKKAAHARLVGKIVAGRYRIRNIVGAGGHGLVYEADDIALGRTVALKVPKGRPSPQTLMRFRREARAGKTVRHPNVCAFYQEGMLDDGAPYLVMERLVGETLGARLARDEVMTLAAAVSAMVQALSGLAAAHQAGLVHRDMKPGNIFLSSIAGPMPMAKVLDFGLSIFGQLEGDADEVTELSTDFGTVVGTPRYMSPEQVQGFRDFDARVDVFACGAIFYEMVTGRRAFTGSGTRELFDQIVAAKPTPPSRIDPSLPPALDRVVSRAMAPDRDQRYAGAADFAGALSGLLTSAPTPVMAWAPGSAAGGAPTERQAYLQSRFRELVALRQQGFEQVTPMRTTKRSSAVEIPIYFDDSASGGRIPNLIPSEEDPEGTAPTRPKRTKKTRADSTTQRVLPTDRSPPGSSKRPRRR